MRFDVTDYSLTEGKRGTVGKFTYSEGPFERWSFPVVTGYGRRKVVGGPSEGCPSLGRNLRCTSVYSQRFGFSEPPFFCLSCVQYLLSQPTGRVWFEGTSVIPLCLDGWNTSNVVNGQSRPIVELGGHSRVIIYGCDRTSRHHTSSMCSLLTLDVPVLLKYPPFPRN